MHLLQWVQAGSAGWGRLHGPTVGRGDPPQHSLHHIHLFSDFGLQSPVIELFIFQFQRQPDEGRRGKRGTFSHCFSPVLSSLRSA